MRRGQERESQTKRMRGSSKVCVTRRQEDAKDSWTFWPCELPIPSTTPQQYWFEGYEFLRPLASLPCLLLTRKSDHKVCVCGGQGRSQRGRSAEHVDHNWKGRRSKGPDRQLKIDNRFQVLEIRDGFVLFVTFFRFRFQLLTLVDE